MVTSSLSRQRQVGGKPNQKAVKGRRRKSQQTGEKQIMGDDEERREKRTHYVESRSRAQDISWEYSFIRVLQVWVGACPLKESTKKEKIDRLWFLHTFYRNPKGDYLVLVAHGSVQRDPFNKIENGKDPQIRGTLPKNPNQKIYPHLGRLHMFLLQLLEKLLRFSSNYFVL